MNHFWAVFLAAMGTMMFMLTAKLTNSMSRDNGNAGAWAVALWCGSATIALFWAAFNF